MLLFIIQNRSERYVVLMLDDNHILVNTIWLTARLGSANMFAMANNYSAEVVKKAIKVLRFIVKQREARGVTQIAANLGFHSSTTFGILQALKDEGLIEQDRTTKRYRIGNEFVLLSQEVLVSTRLSSFAKPFMDGLARKVQETVCLGVIEKDRVKVVEVVEADKKYRISTPVGASFPIATPAILKVFLGALGAVEARAFLKEKPLPSYTRNSITNVMEMLGEAEDAAHSGYATDLEEFQEGIRAVLSPVFVGEELRAFIWISGLAGSLNDSVLPSLIEHLVRTARQISAALSGKDQGDWLV